MPQNVPQNEPLLAHNDFYLTFVWDTRAAGPPTSWFRRSRVRDVGTEAVPDRRDSTQAYQNTLTKSICGRDGDHKSRNARLRAEPPLGGLFLCRDFRQRRMSLWLSIRQLVDCIELLSSSPQVPGASKYRSDSTTTGRRAFHFEKLVYPETVGLFS
jgi:hypothetical protein